MQLLKGGRAMSPYLAAALGLILGIVLGFALNKYVLSARAREAQASAERKVSRALEQAETTRKEMLLEAKAEILNLRADAEEEVKERRKEIVGLENRLI